LSHESDTTKVNILKKRGGEFMKVADYNHAKKYLDEALALAQQIAFKRGIAICYNNIGIIYRKQGNYPEALKNHFAALFAKKSGIKKYCCFLQQRQANGLVSVETAHDAL
jgi:tetratricopeptide (TPR) repeat protein